MFGLSLQDSKWRSVSGHPVTFADWNEPGQAYRRPVLLQAPDVETKISEVVQTMQHTWHPVNDMMSNCTALLYMGVLF